jgi:hypothetical protein
MRSLDRELRRLPRVTTTLEGPPTDARLAELGLLGFTVEVNVSRLAAASGQLDCDARVVFVTLPGRNRRQLLLPGLLPHECAPDLLRRTHLVDLFRPTAQARQVPSDDGADRCLIPHCRT